MNIKRLSSALIITSVTFLSCNGQKKAPNVKLANEVDSVSYGIGLSIGNNLAKDGLEGVNLDVMMKAMKSAINKDSLIMDQQAAGAVIQQYVTTIKKKKGESAVANEQKFMDENAKKPGVKTLESGMQYIVMKEGTGAKPTAADTVICHYHGTMLDGKVFDSSVERGEPATFPVSGVIPGWTEALQLMPVGSKWKLFIPSKLAYGERGAGGMIEPNSTLIFEVELLSIKGK
ncbi:MAG: FKBP-type peptidyl-prolyl cis-trans isomerase [Bacteroidia bacterium]|nr:FKBP-type peptidyl-prolyl cis-trans isomerase [Bacteroidia bacterium]